MLDKVVTTLILQTPCKMHTQGFPSILPVVAITASKQVLGFPKICVCVCKI